MVPDGLYRVNPRSGSSIVATLPPSEARRGVVVRFKNWYAPSPPTCANDWQTKRRKIISKDIFFIRIPL